MKAKNILGFKLFKEDQDGIHMIRIVKVKESSQDEFSTLTIKDYDTDELSKVKIKDLEGYTPLEPDAVLTASVVNLHDNNGELVKDVVVTANKYIYLKVKALPYAVCRQNVIDVFNELFLTSEENNIVGLSINKDNCPAGFDFQIMFAADEIEKHVFVNFYRTDTLEDIIEMVPLHSFNEVLFELYQEHCNYKKDPKAFMAHEDDGWCDNLELLLKVNNFQYDLDQMLGITPLDFDIEPYIIYKPIPGNESEEYGCLREDIKAWLSSIYKININEANIIEYDHDINLADYNNSAYFLFRDINNKVYLVVYTVDGEYLESDLEAKEKELDFSTKFKIKFYNKYNNSNDSIIQN